MHGKRKWFWMAVALGSAVGPPDAMADVSITWSGSGTHSVLENQIFNEKRQITLYGEGLAAVIATITATSGTEPIRYIHVRSKDVAGGTSAVVVNVVEGGGTIPYVENMIKDPGYTSTGEFWISAFDISGTIGESGTAEGGEFEADYMSQLLAGGDLNATVTVGEHTIAGLSLALIDVEGDLRGDVSALHGKIKDVFITGDVGSSTNTVSIDARDGIRRLSAGSIWADIAANANSGSGSISRLRANVGGFSGSLTANRLEQDTAGDNILITGDLAADLTFTNDIRLPIEVGGDLTGDIDATALSVGTPSGSITVDGSLTGSVTLDADGLEGQIVVNAADGSDTWTGPVVVGSYTLDDGSSQPNEAPYYERESTDLGGGAIGLVPFMFHAVESDPAHDSVITTGAFTGDVVVEHYGPVAEGDDEDEEPAVRVYRLALQVPPPGTVPDPETTEVCDEHWTDVTSSYTISVSGRTVTVSGSFSNWRAYEVVPNDLVCDIDGSPAVIYAQGWQGTVGCGGTESYGYGFQVKTGGSMFDLNLNMSVESGDIETWAYSPADFDDDGDADVVDLSLLVDAVVNGDE